MDFKNWLETRIPFTKADVDNFAQEHGYVPMWIDKDGNVNLDYQSGPSPMARQIFLRPKEKTIDLKRNAFSGVHVWPRVQQLLNDLIKKGIIDSTWKIAGDNVGRYVNRKFERLPGDIESKTAGDLANQSSRLTAITDDLVFFHGTSEKDWEKIQKVGIHPLGSKFVSNHGFESRGKHDLNKNLVYLASKLEGAWGYAEMRTRSVMKEMMSKEWEHYQYVELCSWPIKPIVLRVHVPDASKLRSDDDAANEIMREWARRLWDSKSKEEQEKIIKKLTAKTGLDVKQFPAMIWRESDEGFQEILNRVPKRIWHKWLASIRRYDQVGYKGYIPPTHIEPIKTC